jgi:endonuclease III
MTDADGRKLLRRTLKLLRRAYGPREWSGPDNAVDELVATILSQNTSDANSSAGYRRLRRRFRKWSTVADAPVEEVERCIRVSGLSRIKAPRIQGILRQIRRERGTIDLEYLAALAPADAYRQLVRFDGVGPKTALCVLLFALGVPVFPVDTHIFRIARRLGVLPEAAPAERAHEVLMPLIPPKDRYAMHVLLIAHGREVCRAQNPKCLDCDLLPLCPFGQQRAPELEERES